MMATTFHQLAAIGIVSCMGCSAASDPSSPQRREAPTSDSDPQLDAELEHARERMEQAVVLRLDAEPGHTLTLYEVSHGELVWREEMLPGQRFVTGDSGLSRALRLFVELYPRAAVPQVVVEAYRRARTRAEELRSAPDRLDLKLPQGSGGGEQAPILDSTEPASRIDSHAGQIRQALTSSSSATTFINSNGMGNFFAAPLNIWHDLKVNWANGYWVASNANSSIFFVDHYSGNGVMVRLTRGTVFDFAQDPGTIVGYFAETAGAIQNNRWDVLNAGGDRFHVKFTARDCFHESTGCVNFVTTL